MSERYMFTNIIYMTTNYSTLIYSIFTMSLLHISTSTQYRWLSNGCAGALIERNTIMTRVGRKDTKKMSNNFSKKFNIMGQIGPPPPYNGLPFPSKI